jgi:hypothetical protein
MLTNAILTNEIDLEVDLSLRLQSVLQVAAEQSRVSLATVESLSRALLAMPIAGIGQRGGRSGLNHDGSPLQVCFTATRQGIHSRLLGDPAFVLGDPYVRFLASRSALQHLLELTDSLAIQDLCDRTLAVYVPTQISDFSRFDSGVLWLGAGIQSPGCALYVDARQSEDTDAAWDLAQVWLSQLLPSDIQAQAAIAVLRPVGQLLSIGIEGSKLSNARAKLYWRFQRPVQLDQLDIDLLHDPLMTSFLIEVIRDRTLHLSGIVPSIGFRVATGELFDAKIDICGHCLAYDPATWMAVIQACTEQYELAPLPLVSALRQSRISYLGLGLDHQHHVRLNLYLKTAHDL